MIEGESGILNTSPPHFRPRYFPTKRLVEWPNGCKAYCYSSEKARQFTWPAASFLVGAMSLLHGCVFIVALKT